MQLTNDNLARTRPGVKRKPLGVPRVDMTPMVDLGFLLICFFVMTTELSKPVVTTLVMPKDGPPTKLANSTALTVLLTGNGNAYTYEGSWEDALLNNAINRTSLYENNGLRQVILAKKEWLLNHGPERNDKDLMLLIKLTSDAPYKNLVDALDETTINNVRKFAIVKLEKPESEWLAQNQ